MGRLINERECSEYLGMSLSYLRQKRSLRYRRTSGSPPFIKIGAAVRYDTQALDAWLDKKVAASAEGMVREGDENDY